jgi:hypothetical protein
LRVTNALRDKELKRAKYVKEQVVGDDDPFVVAICLGGVEDANAATHKPGPPLVARALLGVGELYSTIPIDSDGPSERGVLFHSSIAKASGSEVSVRGFLDGSHPGISGVFVTTHSIVHMHQTPGQDFAFLHNPTARNPLPLGCFPFGKEHFVRDGLMHTVKHFASGDSLGAKAT